MVRLVSESFEDEVALYARTCLWFLKFDDAQIACVRFELKSDPDDIL